MTNDEIIKMQQKFSEFIEKHKDFNLDLYEVGKQESITGDTLKTLVVLNVKMTSYEDTREDEVGRFVTCIWCGNEFFQLADHLAQRTCSTGCSDCETYTGVPEDKKIEWEKKFPTYGWYSNRDAAESAKARFLKEWPNVITRKKG